VIYKATNISDNFIDARNIGYYYSCIVRPTICFLVISIIVLSGCNSSRNEEATKNFSGQESLVTTEPASEEMVQEEIIQEADTELNKVTTDLASPESESETITSESDMAENIDSDTEGAENDSSGSVDIDLSDYEFNGVRIEPPVVAFDIAGVDGEEAPFRLSNHQGEYTLVNFGYTFCPDICPFTLSHLSRFYRELEKGESELAEQVNVIFVSVDPERDTPKVLDNYTNAFHEDFYGIYIEDSAALEATKAGFHVSSEKRQGSPNAKHYFVDHTGGTYVINREGKIRLFFAHDTEPEQILADITYLLRYN